MVAHELGGDDKTVTTDDVLLRIGIVDVGERSEEYWERAQHEVADTERHLAEFRREVLSQVAKCHGQLDVMAREARAEEEKRLLSERVESELQTFREEMRQKEAREEERLRHVYRAIIDPVHNSSASHAYFGQEGMEHRLLAGTRAVPPIIASTVSLLATSSRPTNSSPELVTVQSVRLPELPHSQVGIRHGKFTRQPSSMPAAPSLPYMAETRASAREEHKLLQLNLARLERLERMGL